MGVRNYLAQLWALLPPGRAWRREEGSRQDRTLQAISDELGRADARALDLMDELDPRTTSELLDEWERELGLPGDCAPPPVTDEERRSAIISRLVAVGRQDEAYFVEIAAQIGITITITHEQPFLVGSSGMGDPIGGSEWRHVWNVTADSYPYEATRASFECTINRYKPAHTVVLFEYYGPLVLEGYSGHGFLLTESSETLAIRYE